MDWNESWMLAYKVKYNSMFIKHTKMYYSKAMLVVPVSGSKVSGIENSESTAGDGVTWRTIININYHAYYNKGKRHGHDGPKTRWLVYGAVSYVARTSIFSEGWKDSSWEAEQVPTHSAVWEVSDALV